MVTFDKLVQKAKDDLGEDVIRLLNLGESTLDNVIGRIVKSTVGGCGLYVEEHTGEVGDPRPRPAEHHYVPGRPLRRGRMRR